MSGAELKNFDKADEVRLHAGLGHSDVVTVGGQAVMRGTYEPGWRWSTNLRPIVGGDLCQIRHLGYLVSGTLRIYLADGGTMDIGPGEVASIDPGHDAEVIGSEDCVFIDFGDVASFAKRG